MDSALTFTETPSVPDDSLKWKYLLSWESWRSFSRCACWSVLCGCDIFLAGGIFVLGEWMELMLALPVTLALVAQPLLAQQLYPGCHSLLPSTAKFQGGADIVFSLHPWRNHITNDVSEMSGLPLTRAQQSLVCYGRFTLWLREERSEREDSKIYYFSHLSASSSPKWKPVLVFTLSNNSFIPETSFMS